MSREWMIMGSYSNGMIRGGSHFVGTKAEVDQKAYDMIHAWFFNYNSFVGEIYYSDMDDISHIQGGYYYNSDNGYDKRKITKMSKSYAYNLECLINS